MKVILCYGTRTLAGIVTHLVHTAVPPDTLRDASEMMVNKQAEAEAVSSVALTKSYINHACGI